MNFQLPVNRLRRAVAEFGKADRGNVAMIFAFSILPLLALVGAAVDYTRANNARTAMQQALDSTALMISKDADNLTAQQVSDKAIAYFNALYRNQDAQNVQVTAYYTPPTAGKGATVVVNGTGVVTTDFMKVAGYPQINIGSSATTTWGNVKLRVALALDNTGSMADDSKMATLIPAAKNLVDQLKATATDPGDVYISVVPFAKDVNVGTGNVNASWVKWNGSSDTWDENNGTCTAGSSYKTKSTCEAKSWCSLGSSSSYNTQSKCTSSGTCSNSSYSSQSSCTSAQACSKSQYTSQNRCTQNGGTWGNANYTWTAGVWQTGVWTANAHSTWTGCVMDRDQSYDTLNTAPGSAATNFPAEQYSACPTSLMGLSYDWDGLKTKIGNMVPNGGTNQAIGLAWAWQSLTQTAPLNAPTKDTNYIYKDVIILMTDGLNTQDRWPAYGNGNTQYNGQIDARQQILCDNIKNQGVTIYTIQVNTTGDPTQSVLQYCASGSSNFFLLTSANELIATFNNIGTQLSKLRVAQ